MSKNNLFDLGTLLMYLTLGILSASCFTERRLTATDSYQFFDENTKACANQVVSDVGLVGNGDFEYPVYPNNWNYQNPGNLSGWFSVQSEIGRGPYYNPNWPASTGQVIELDGANLNLNYTQTFNLASNKFYKFSIQCAPRGLPHPLSSSGFYVTLNGRVIINDSQPQSYRVINYTYDFMAYTNSTTLALCGAGIPNNYGTTCDNVNIYEILESTNERGEKCTFCQLYDDLCEECSNETGSFLCTKCLPGYFLEEGVCYTCKNVHYACNICSNSSVCEQCDDPTQCRTQEYLEKMATAAAIGSYAGLFFALISGKIVGLQLFGVLQLTFFNLADDEFVNLYLRPFLSWRFMNGYNLPPSVNIRNQRYPPLSHTQGRVLTGTIEVVPKNILALGYTHSFISNMNIMLLVLVLWLLVAIIVYFLSRLVVCLVGVGQFMLKQLFLTLFLFNCFNIFFCAGLHFRYTDPSNTEDYAFSSFAAITAVSVSLLIIFLFMTNKGEGFGEFTGKFKKGPVTQLYIIFVICYRIVLSLYLSLGHDTAYGNMLILTAAFLFLLYLLVNLPFTDTYQNYRAALCHMAQLAILVISNFYNTMLAYQTINVKGSIFSPALLQIGIVVVVVVVSLVCLVYEIYLFVRRKCRRHNAVADCEKEKAEIPVKKTEENINNSQQSMNQMNDMNVF